MTIKEAERLSIMKQVALKKLKQREASESLGLSLRQTQRLLRSYREEGAQGLISKKRGKINPRKMPLERRLKIMGKIREKYPDFGPTFASEKLREEEDILVSRETLRKLMIEEGIWKAKKKERKKGLSEKSKKKPRGRTCSSRRILPRLVRGKISQMLLNPICR